MRRTFYWALLVLTHGICIGGDKIDEILPKMLVRLRDVGQVLAPLPEDIAVEAVYNLASYYIPVDSETAVCRNHSTLLFESFLKNEIWALKMMDASSKVPAGLLDGYLMDLGNYDQCLSVEAPQKLFTGQHCFIETRGLLPEDINVFNSELEMVQPLRVDFAMSLCVPSSCTARDVQIHMNVALNSVNASAHLRNSSCSSITPTQFTRGDYFAISVLSSLAIAVVISSWYDSSRNPDVKKSLLTSFSVFQNTSQLFAKDTNPHSVLCLHGIRVLALSWIVLGHRMFHQIRGPQFRLKDFVQNLANISWAPMQQVILAVEVFFVISGALVAYNFFKDQKNGKTFKYLEFCLHRYRRLTPSLAVMVLLTATLAVRLADGPVWGRAFEHQTQNCQVNWWTSLLYISNYVRNTGMCMVHTWYLSADFQLHMLAPVLLLLLKKYKRLGFLALGTLMMASVSAIIYDMYMTESVYLGTFRMDQRNQEYFLNSYMKIQYRAVSFLMGIWLGYFIFQIKQDNGFVKLSKTQVWTGWIVSLLLILGSVFSVVIFLDSRYVPNVWVDSVALVLQRYTFALAFSWIILMCVLGHGGKINEFLSWKGWVPLSRLSYGMYLVHYLLQDVHTLRTRVPLSVSAADTWFLFTADFTTSFILSTVLYLLVEAPCANLFKHLRA